MASGCFGCCLGFREMFVRTNDGFGVVIVPLVIWDEWEEDATSPAEIGA